jgi:hypothetical protein
MFTGNLAILLAVPMVAGGALYIRMRRWRSPRAYRAMIGLAVCYCAAGALIGAWAVHLVASGNAGSTAASGPAASAPSTTGGPAIAARSGGDGQAIANYLAQTRDLHIGDPCEAVGMYADMAAMFRKLGRGL